MVQNLFVFWLCRDIHMVGEKEEVHLHPPDHWKIGLYKNQRRPLLSETKSSVAAAPNKGDLLKKIKM